MKTIGIIGGMGWQSSATYYRVMNNAVRSQLGGQHSARILLDSLDFDAIAGARTPDDFERVRDLLVGSAKRLEAAGASSVLMACNTVHRFAQSVEEALSTPLLHIADAAGARLLADGHTRVGLMGSIATTQGSFYKHRLKERFGITALVPDGDSRTGLNRLILEGLHSAADPRACAAPLDAIIEELKEAGASAVLLACTELGLAYGFQDESVIQRALPAYDTAILHAQAAVELSLKT